MHDLMVIGDDVSSYIAAAVGAKFGLNTVHIAEHNFKDMFLNDIFFNADVFPITGFGEGQSVNSVLKELGIELENILSPLNPAYQVILPEHRIDFFFDKDALVNDFVREFPQKEKEIISFYNTVEKNAKFLQNWLSNHPFSQINSFKQYFNYFKLFFNLLKFKSNQKKFERIVFSNPSFRKACEAQLALLSSDIKAFQCLSSAYHFFTPMRGVSYFPKGKSDFIEALLAFFQSAGGEYSNNFKLLTIRKSNMIEAEVMDDQGIISNIQSKYLIISDKSEGMKLFYKKQKKINTDKWLKRIKVTHYPLTLHFVLREKCLPEKISHHVALITDINKDIYDDNLIILEINEPNKEKRTTHGNKLLTATIFLSSDQDTWKRENLVPAADSAVSRLEYFLPFMKDNLKFYDIDKSIDISMKYRNIINPKYKVRKHLFSGFSAQNNITPLKNVYITGGSLFTDIGWEGEIISGMYAVYKILKKGENK